MKRFALFLLTLLLVCTFGGCDTAKSSADSSEVGSKKRENLSTAVFSCQTATDVFEVSFEYTSLKENCNKGAYVWKYFNNTRNDAPLVLAVTNGICLADFDGDGVFDIYSGTYSIVNVE